MPQKSPRKRIFPPMKARLPAELMLLVVNSVTDTPTLRNLSLTSKGIHTFAQPLLFEHVSFMRSREHSIKLVDVLCSESDSRLYRLVKEVKISVNALIPQAYHDEVKRSKKNAKLYNQNPLPVHIRSSKYSYSYTPEKTAEEWASHLEFHLTRFWMSCCRNIRSISCQVGVKGYGSSDEMYLNEKFCTNVALFPFMRCCMPKLETVELQGTYPSSVGTLLRALMLPELPEYVDDFECANKIKENVQLRMFWPDRVHGASGPKEGNIVGDNLKRIRNLKLLMTETCPVEFTAGLALQLSPGPLYDAIGLLSNHIKPTNLTLDFRERVGLADLLSGVALRLDPDDEFSGEGFKIPRTPQPEWYVNGLEELSLANCTVTSSLSTTFGEMRKLRRLHLDSVQLDDKHDTWGAAFQSCANISSLVEVKLSHLHYYGDSSRSCGGPEGWSDAEWRDNEDKLGDKPLLLTIRSPGARPRQNKFILCSKQDEDKDGLLELYKSQLKKHASSFSGNRWDKRDWIVCWHGNSFYK